MSVLRSSALTESGQGRLLVVAWVLAVILALAGLGDLPLRDWDEAIAARVALELSAKPSWLEALMPTYWGSPYLNKPPGLHLLMAQAIRLWQGLGANSTAGLPPEWVIRGVPALLSTLVVPLGGWIQRELRPRDPLASAATALILLSLLPVARHGRMAMLDGTQLSAMALLWLCLLKSRAGRSNAAWAWCTGGGLAGSALLMLKAPIVIPALAAGLLALALEPAAARPTARVLLLGLLAGLLPGIAWHGLHLYLRGTDALHLWLGDGAARVLFDAGEGSGQGWRVPVLKMLEGGWPWLALWPFGLVLSWRERHLSRGRWPLVLQLVLALSILPLRTQLPWYSHPLWLPMALLTAPVLVWLIRRRAKPPEQPPPFTSILQRVPALWVLLGSLIFSLSLCTTVPSLAMALKAIAPLRGCLMILGAGWLISGIALLAPQATQRLAGAAALGLSTWLALLALMVGPHWNWELAEHWRVAPVADLVRRHPDTQIWIWAEPSRPSLSWYAGQEIRRLKGKQLALLKDTFLVLSRSPELPAPATCQRLETEAGWQLLECSR